MRRLGILVAMLSLAGEAAANPVDTYGLGSRSTAMGGAVSADVTDFSACYYNPSGLALARGMDFSIGYMRAHHTLEMNGIDSKVDPVHGLVGGIVAPGSIGFLPFAFGIATHLSDERLSRARTMKVEEPRWVFYDNRPQLLYISADLAIRPFEWLALGGGVTFLAATRGGFGITGTADLDSPYDSQLRHEVDADLSSVRYPVFGITLRPHETLDVGLVYRGEAKVELDIDAELEGDIDATLVVPARYTLVSHTANIFIPRQVVLGTSFHPTEKLHVNVDLTWVNWAAYESPISETRTVLDVDVSPTLGIELPPNPKPTKAQHPGFKNRIVPRIGVEYRVEVTRRKLHLPLRVGYLYEHSPVPDQTGITNYVDTDRHAISAGLGLIWEEPGAVLPGDLRLDFHGQYSILPTRVTTKDSAADYIGDYRANGTILSGGATLSLGFR